MVINFRLGAARGLVLAGRSLLASALRSTLLGLLLAGPAFMEVPAGLAAFAPALADAAPLEGAATLQAHPTRLPEGAWLQASADDDADESALRIAPATELSAALRLDGHGGGWLARASGWAAPALGTPPRADAAPGGRGRGGGRRGGGPQRSAQAGVADQAPPMMGGLNFQNRQRLSQELASTVGLGLSPNGMPRLSASMTYTRDWFYLGPGFSVEMAGRAQGGRPAGVTVSGPPAGGVASFRDPGRALSTSSRPPGRNVPLNVEGVAGLRRDFGRFGVSVEARVANDLSVQYDSSVTLRY